VTDLLPESEFQKLLVETLTVFHWDTMHVYPLRTKHGWRTPTTAKGWPDLVGLRQTFILAIEVKGFDSRGKPTPFQEGQIEWLARFAAIPTGRAWVLRPTDDLSQIARWLATPATAPGTYGWDPTDIGKPQRPTRKR
jgi:hypothetical protein